MFFNLRFSHNLWRLKMSSSSINHVSSGGSPSVIPSVGSGSEEQQGCLGKLASKVNSLFYSIIAMIKSCWHESHGVFKIVPPLALLVGGASLTIKKLFSSSPVSEKEIVAAHEEEAIPVSEKEIVTAHEEEAIPGSEKEIVAAHEEEAIPVSEKEIVAAHEEEAIPVSEKEIVAAHEEEAIPVSEKEIVTAHEEEAIPGSEKEIVAAHEEEAISVAHDKKTEASQAERAKKVSDLVKARIAPTMTSPTFLKTVLVSIRSVGIQKWAF